ncbi:MAG: alpha/beta hydrolase [Shimia sp.]|uniref:alpha/beta hydrolase n=1 Tax=Shimia sp. TaxID=1954381 RepID=UPI004057D823
MRFLIRLAVICAMLFGATMVLGNFAERLLIYPFDSTRVSPNDAGLNAVQEHVVTVEGERIIVWTAPPRKGQPVIFYLHGNAGNLALRAGRFQRFMARGYGLVALAYPGSSGSSGTPSEERILATAKHVWAEKKDLLPTNAPTSKTVIYGESLGSAVALHLNALLVTDKTTVRPSGIILEAPFTSVVAMAEYHYPGMGALVTNFDNQWNSLDRASVVQSPLLVLHGTQDTLIPIEMGQQIHAAAPFKNKQLLSVQGAGHTDLWRSDVLPNLFGFIDQCALR